MFSNDSRLLHRACLVTPDGMTLRHPILNDLPRSDGTLHVIAGAEYAATKLPSAAHIREFNGDGPAERSDHARYAVERLHREHRFDLIVFAGVGGLGARAIQAKRAGLAFADVPLAVYLDGNTQRDREASRRWPTCFADVETDYLERWRSRTPTSSACPTTNYSRS